ncbi:MAG: hypothetical protein RL701_229 [Pseudomonadota bacterium]|jgi:uncharacterized repeat protein (TIGR04052 family)
MRRSWLVSGALLWAVSACGDDDDDSGAGGHAGDAQAGTSGAATGSAANGGDGANAGAGQSASGQGAAADGGGGQSGQGGQSGASGATNNGGSGARISVPASQAITITFKAKIGGSDFACGQTATGQGLAGSRVTPIAFKAFVQDVTLLDETDQEIPVTLDIRAPWQSRVVALLDFENATGACSGSGSAATNVVITGTVPPGTYKGISFSNGVPDYANHVNPTKLLAPLHDNAALWDAVAGFRFLDVALKTLPPWLDPEDPDAGVAALPAGAGAELHVGSAGCADVVDADAGTSGIRCDHPNRNRVHLSPYTLGQSVIVADLAKAFGKLDLDTPNSCDSGGDGCAAPFKSLGIESADGEAAATQSFYRVE